MGATDPGSAREEAERLVATLLATARLAAAGSGGGPWGPLGGIVSGVLGHSAGRGGSSGPTGGGFATGTPECCVCPVCRAVAALRDPSPEFAERLATGAGDLAAGVASLLRAFAPAEPAERTESASPSAERTEPASPSAERTEPAPRRADDLGSAVPVSGAGDHVWREATRSGHDSPSAPDGDVWSAATRAEDGSRPAAAPPADAAGQASAPTPAGPAVVPASRAPADTGADGRGPAASHVDPGP